MSFRQDAMLCSPAPSFSRLMSTTLLADVKFFPRQPARSQQKNQNPYPTTAAAANFRSRESRQDGDTGLTKSADGATPRREAISFRWSVMKMTGAGTVQTERREQTWAALT